jgi:asparagine synthase (glutamine-hydrolysing)
MSQMQAVDYKTYLCDDIFTKVDRATMAVGLEAREPLVDHKIAEYIARVPISLKYKDGESKYILRKILYKYVPKELLERPKHGFGIPIDSWFKKDLKGVLREYLSEKNIKNQGIFNENYIKESLDRYLSGKSDSAYNFWFLLVFQMWYEKWMK